MKKSLTLNPSGGYEPQILQGTRNGRWYVLPDGSKVPSGSTIPAYGMYEPPFLFKWKLEKSGGNYEVFQNIQSIESRIGDCVHRFADDYVNKRPVDLTSDDINDYIRTDDILVTSDAVTQIRNGVQSFVTFWDHHNPELIANEQLVWSEKKDEHGKLLLPFCGRIDLVIMLDGKVTLADTKTSKVVKDNIKFLCQMGIYKLLWDDMHPDMPIEQMGIIHANKTFKGTTPPASVKTLVKYKFDEDLVWDTYRMFMHCYPGFDSPVFSAKKEASPKVFLYGGDDA